VRRRRRARLLFIVGMAALVVDPGFVTATRPAAAAEPVRVMQYNVCGAICNGGVVAKPGRDNDVVEDVRNRIVAARPHIVTLNEVCNGQFARLKNVLQGSHWPMDGVFRKQRNDGRCKDGSGFGDAVLTAGPVGRTEVLQLPDRGSEDRAIICVHTYAHGPVLACALHLVTGQNGTQERLEQLAAAAKALNRKAAERAVIVGGDFNTVPSGMGALLDRRRGGRFFDVDPQREGTRGNKIDYVLFSRGHFSNPSGGPVWSRFSDHKVLIGLAIRH